MRVHGTLDVVDPAVLTAEDTERLMKEITPPRYQQQIQEQGSADFAYAYSDLARFRTNVYRSQGRIGTVMRLIPHRKLSFAELGLPREHIIPILHSERGLCLITGPTGSGKSTTLATMIDYINGELYRHIITIEDPIEYTHQHKKSIVTHRELHVDTPSFSAALRVALRQDPDVILVGEMRDLETMEAAIMAAETGHLVFATLHTNSASQTVDRIIDAFPANQQQQIRSVLSVALGAVISQTLCPLASGKGRAAAYEIMFVTPAISNLIREHKTERIISTLQTSAKQGMSTMDDFLFKLFREGKISGETALWKAHYPNDMRQKLLAPEDDVGSTVKSSADEIGIEIS
jgi:twitching motility protein PilT